MPPGEPRASYFAVVSGAIFSSVYRLARAVIGAWASRVQRWCSVMALRMTSLSFFAFSKCGVPARVQHRAAGHLQCVFRQLREHHAQGPLVERRHRKHLLGRRSIQQL